MKYYAKNALRMAKTRNSKLINGRKKNSIKKI